MQRSCGLLGLASGGLGDFACPFFSSRKDAEPQRNTRLLTTFYFGEISIYCSRGVLPRRTVGQYANRKSSLNSPFAPEEQYLFFAQRNYGPLGMTSGGLCGLASLRALFFFLLAKTYRPACGRQAQRNCGPLGLTSAGREPARKCQSFTNKLHVTKLVILCTFLELLLAV